MSKYDTTVKGGKYIVRKQTVDANGRPFGEKAEGDTVTLTKAQYAALVARQEQTKPFPEDFKFTEAFEKAGVTSLEQARAMSDEDLLALEGIGEAAVKAVRG